MALASATSAHFCLLHVRAHFFFASCAAARAGKVDVLARAKELGAPLTADVCLAAAEGGDVPTIEAAVTLGAPLARQQVTDAWHRAIEKGRVEMMAWLREYDPKHCDWIGHRIVRPWRRVLGPCGRAARWGRLAALQWLRSSDRMHDLSHKYGRPVQINQNNGRTKHVFDDAFDVPQDQRPEQFDFMAMCNAGKSSPYQMKWLCFVCARATQSLDAHVRICSISLDFFLFFVDTGPCPWTEAMAPHERGGTCGFAAGHGHLDVLRWLRSRNPPCPWSGETTLLAAKGCRIDMLKWLRDPDTGGGVCPWDARVTAAAAGNFGFLHENDPIVPDQPQQIAALAWMRAQSPPCPWDHWTCSHASSNGRFEVLKWARAQDPPARGTPRPSRWRPRAGTCTF